MKKYDNTKNSAEMRVEAEMANLDELMSEILKKFSEISAIHGLEEVYI
ncbi:MAG: hypothetical protein LBD41_03020 [Clostridiales Family XIII bacterium]|jgi:hypothetical protein|nr:hypothetical protein [Clostridiales Family XIII bacterium]